MKKNAYCLKFVDLGFVDYAIMQDQGVFNVTRATWYDSEVIALFSNFCRASTFLKEFLSIE